MAVQSMINRLMRMQEERIFNLNRLQELNLLADVLDSIEKADAELRIFELVVNTAQIELQMSKLLNKCAVSVWAKVIEQREAPFVAECVVKEEEIPF